MSLTVEAQDSSGAESLHEKLVTVDEVDVLVGPDWTPIGFPVSPIPDKHRIPAVLANVSALQIFQRGFKYVFGAPTPSVFVWSHRYFDLLAKQPPHRPRPTARPRRTPPILAPRSVVSGRWPVVSGHE